MSPVFPMNSEVSARSQTTAPSRWDLGAEALVHPTGLPAFEARLRDDLQQLCLPRPAWSENGSDPELLDILIIGAGQFGIGLGAALRLNGVTNFRILDQAPKGREGPWVTFARMPTLRSPKHHPGICFGVPSLTFQAWYRAAHGSYAWDALYKIPNRIWQDYLDWVRDTLALPVRNDARAVDLRQVGRHVETTLADGEVIRARRVVVANGRGGAGGWARIPGVADDLWPDLAAHTTEPVDFAALRGKRVAVIGTGSSAWDNAATALEQGAAGVDMFARRKAVPQLNKGRATGGIHFTEGWADLPDADRWRLAWYLDSMGAPPPHETVLRTARLPGFTAHFDCGAITATRHGDRLRVETASGQGAEYDFLILGSGFRNDLSQEPLFASIQADITLWADRYDPPEAYRKPALGLQPYVAADFSLIGKNGAALDRIHLCNAATYVSAGSMTADVPTLDIAPARLVSGLVRALFVEDFDQSFDQLLAWEEEHELKPTPFYAPEHVNTTAR